MPSMDFENIDEQLKQQEQIAREMDENERLQNMVEKFEASSRPHSHHLDFYRIYSGLILIYFLFKLIERRKVV